MTNKLQKISVKGVEINAFSKNGQDYISLTDIARYKDQGRSDYLVQNWMRTKTTIEFIGLWEKLNNPNFNSIEFDVIKKSAGSNNFILSPKRWTIQTKSIGIFSKTGRYGGGTYAHLDIAYEFATWISPEFKLYLIKEFQRLKQEESVRLAQGWDVKRLLTRINYKIHTDAVRNHLIPAKIVKSKANLIYASEADILNVALFGKTAQEWRGENQDKQGNIRDYAEVIQLVVLANLESMNAELIGYGLSQSDRLIQLNHAAITQMQSLLDSAGVKKLKYWL